MRRSIAAVMLGVLVAGFLPAAAQAQQVTNVAMVYKLMLDQNVSVFESPNDLDQVRPGVLGDLLKNGQLVTTDENTRAAIKFTDDSSILRMNPNTLLQITAEGDKSALNKTLQIDAGELWARIRKNPEASYTIQTPTAVAAVKGTEFYVRVAADGSTTIITTEGVLDFFNEVGTVEVPAGSTAQITGGAAAVAPAVADTQPGEIESFGEINADVEKSGGEDLVEIQIPFMDADGNQKVMIIRVPREQAQQYLPPPLG